MIRVLIVDDQAIVRQGLRAMLELEMDIRVVGEAGDGVEAIQAVKQHHPDIVLMDVRMPGMDGLTALEQVKSCAPRTSVIMVTLYDDPNYLLRAVSSGAAGYILKDSRREELVHAVRVTHEGGAIIAPSLLPQILQRMELSRSKAPVPSNELASTLSGREREVLALVAEGYTNKEIAEKLTLSATTIKTHVQNILQKLEASDRTQAAVYAVRCGLI